MKQLLLSAVIITRNEQSMIRDCLKSVQFTDEIIVVDTGNTDKTNIIAQEFKTRIISSQGNNYSQFRIDGLKAVKSKWILYVDADERVSTELATEIRRVITSSQDKVGAFALPRTNIYLGRVMKYGGWGDEFIIRLFRRSDLKKWINPLHEQPVFTGQLEKLHVGSLLHYSHRDLSSMLQKTIEFTTYEANLRYEDHHPPVVWWRFFRVMATEFWLRFIKLSAWRDGVEGCIDGLFQVFNIFIIYAKLWELQQKHK